MPATKSQERLRQVIEEANGLHTKGVLDDADRTRFAALVAEGNALKAAIKTEGEFSELKDWTNQSSGALPLSAGGPDTGVTVHGMRPAGETAIATDYKGGFRLLDEYGEGRLDPKRQAATSTKAYRDAFSEYLRKGQNHTKEANLKVLQEGADTSGGFLIPSDILDRVISKEPTPTRVAGRVTQLQSSRDNLIIPKINYTTDDLGLGVAA